MLKFNYEIVKISDDVGRRNIVFLRNEAIYEWIQKTGTWERHFTDIAKSLLTEGDICIDAGANFGWHTLIMSHLVGNTGKVYSFEPVRILFQQLNTNIFLNGLTNVYTYHSALGNEERYVGVPDLDFFVPDITNYGDTSINYDAKDIPMKTLDNLDIFPSLKLFKIDVQGLELQVLQGSKSNIVINRPYLFVEVESFRFPKYGYKVNDLMNYLKNDLQYSVYKIQSDYAVDHFCVPKEQPFPKLTTNYRIELV